MGDDLKSILQEFVDHLKQEIEDAGEDFDTDWDEIRRYTAIRAEHLSTLVGQPGFEIAVRAERGSIALKIGIAAVDAADEINQRWNGIIQGMLITVAKVLALGLA